MKTTNNHFFGRRVDLPPFLDEGSTYFATDTNEYFYYGADRIPFQNLSAPAEDNDDEVSVEGIQGYLGLLTPFYFNGSATDTVIPLSDINTFVDLNLNLDSSGGIVDQRPTSMKEAQSTGFTGSGTQADPYIILLEGLTLHSFAKFRAIFDFDPDEDEGQLTAKIDVERHSGTGLSNFPIETTLAEMSRGAGVDYPSSVDLSFFIGDTIDTNGVGDAGKVKFQIKSSVPGTVKLREIALYVNK